MKEKVKEELKETKGLTIFPNSAELSYYYSIAKFLFIIVLVVALGLFIINSVMDYRYKNVFIKSPCHLCSELNKNQSDCITGCFTYRLAIYPDGLGNYKNDLGECFNFVGNKINCIGSMLNQT